MKKMNKKGGFTDLFLFMIIAIALVFMCGVMIFIGGKANTEIHDKLDGKMFGDANATVVIDNTIGKVNQSYQALYWISVFLIVGMIISIFIGSYLVTTKPIFLIPYIFITIIAIIVSVGLSNAYELIIEDPTLASTFAGFVGANFILLQLPIWITVIGVVGGIIMFSRMGSKENEGGYYG
jgi:F0F1-type ATP synthase assembly protein I